MEINKSVHEHLRPLIGNETDIERARNILTEDIARMYFLDYARPQFLVFDERFNVTNHWGGVDFKLKNLTSLSSFLSSLSVNTLKINNIIYEMEDMEEGWGKDRVKLIKSETGDVFSLMYKRREIDSNSGEERGVMQATIGDENYYAKLYPEHIRIAGVFENNFLHHSTNGDNIIRNLQIAENILKSRKNTIDLINVFNFAKDVAYNIFSVANDHYSNYTSEIPKFSQKSLKLQTEKPTWSSITIMINEYLTGNAIIPSESIQEILEMRNFVINALPTFGFAPTGKDGPIFVLNNESHGVYDFQGFVESFRIQGEPINAEIANLLLGTNDLLMDSLLLGSLPYLVASRDTIIKNGRQFTIKPNNHSIPSPILINKNILDLSSGLANVEINDNIDMSKMRDFMLKSINGIKDGISDFQDIASMEDPVT